MKNYIFLGIIIFVIVGSTGCKTSSPEKSSTPAAYPGSPTENITQGEPYPIYPTFEPYPFKTSEPNSVTVHGILLIYNPELARPVDDGLFLVPLENSGSTVNQIPNIVVGSTPQAEIDERTGEFTFVNIKPGLYALMVLTTGTGQVPVYKLNEEAYIILDIKESDLNKIIELSYVRLP